MQHATTYHAAKLEQAPAMVVQGKCGHQLQSYVDYLHLALLFIENHVGRLTLHSLKEDLFVQQSTSLIVSS
jgi:hypothetical protein